MSNWGIIGGLGKGLSQASQALFDDEMSKLKESRLNEIRQRERKEDRAFAVEDRNYSEDRADKRAEMAHKFNIERDDNGANNTIRINDNSHDNDVARDNNNNANATQRGIIQSAFDSHSRSQLSKQEFNQRMQLLDKENDLAKDMLIYKKENGVSKEGGTGFEDINLSASISAVSKAMEVAETDEDRQRLTSTLMLLTDRLAGFSRGSKPAPEVDPGKFDMNAFRSANPGIPKEAIDLYLSAPEQYADQFKAKYGVLPQ